MALAGCAREVGAPLGRYAVEGTRVADLDTAFQAAVEPVIVFPFNSAVLSPQARAEIARQAQWLRSNPDAAVRVTGHTDLVGSATYNQRLGQRRAAAVVAQLVSYGISPTRVAGVVSRGESAPVIPVEGPERINRRVEVEVAWLGSVPRGGRGRGLGMDGVLAQNIYDSYQGEGSQVQFPSVDRVGNE